MRLSFISRKGLELLRPGGYMMVVLFSLAALGACGGTQINPSGRSHNVSLQASDLQTYGMCLITPSTVTGKEEDKQALALVFAGAYSDQGPGGQIVTLTETLGKVNSNGLEDEYLKMYKDYRDTGIFHRQTLKKIGEVTGVRYVGHLKLANFSQRSHGRWSILGLRLVKTQESNIRLFMTIWDSSDGSIAWEGMQELNYAYDTFRERPVSFKSGVEEASVAVINRLP